MIARLLALVLAASFSIPAFAEQPDQSEERIKKLAACDEVQAAKHVSLLMIVAVGAHFSSEIQQQMSSYESQMASAQTCAEYASAFQTLTQVFQQVTGQPAESIFQTDEGKKGLEDVIAKLRKLKN